MKKQFSPKWKNSVQRRKQRKYRYNAPAHVRARLVSAHLSKNLRQEYKTRSVQVRTGDEVVIARGEYRKKSGKVTEVDRKKYRILIDGVSRKKVTGQEVNIPVDASNVIVTKLNTDDKARMKALARTRGRQKVVT